MNKNIANKVLGTVAGVIMFFAGLATNANALEMGWGENIGFSSTGDSRVVKVFPTHHSSFNVPANMGFGISDGWGLAGMNVIDRRDGSANSQHIEFITHHGGISAGTRMIIDKGGNVGIGTTSPTEKLTVNGTIYAREIKVDLNVPLADFVFEKNYRLMSLKELEKNIEKRKHLPGIPSAKEVEKNGLKVGEFQNKLLQKIEELTLYLIQQGHKIDNLEKENNSLKTQVSMILKP